MQHIFLFLDLISKHLHLQDFAIHQGLTLKGTLPLFLAEFQILLDKMINPFYHL